MPNKFRDSLAKDGFVIIERFFADGDCRLINEQLNKLVCQQLGHHDQRLSATLETNLLSLYKENFDRYLMTIKSFNRIDSIYKGFIREDSSKIINDLGIKMPLIPTGPVVHLLSDRLKIPNGYFGQGVHQDWSSMQGSLNSLVAWVALSDIDRNNFPIEVIPGSHKRGLLNGELLDDYYKVNAEEYSESDFIPVEVKSGTAIIFSSFLVHRSGVDGKSGFRIAASLRFDDGEEPSFAARGYPTVYRRSVDRPLLEKNFPTLEQVNSQFQSKESL